MRWNARSPELFTFEGKTETTRAEKPGSNLVQVLCATLVCPVSLNSTRQTLTTEAQSTQRTHRGSLRLRALEERIVELYAVSDV